MYTKTRKFNSALKLAVLALIAAAATFWWWPSGPGDPFVVLLGRSPSEDRSAVERCAAAAVEEAARRGALLELGTVGRPAAAQLVSIDMNAEAWSTKRTRDGRAAAVAKARREVGRIMRTPPPSPGASDQFGALSAVARHVRALQLPGDARVTVVLCADGHAVGAGYNVYTDRLTHELADKVARQPVVGHVDLVVGAAGLDVERPVPAAHEERIEAFWHAVAVRRMRFASLRYDQRPAFEPVDGR